ncbi:MAG: ArsR/SmtB family transcription factor [Thermoanaerobaculia bacterium]
MWRTDARNDPRLQGAAELAKALAHPVRIRLLALVRDEELCACQLAALVGLAPSTVSAHVAELRRAGLVEQEKRGRWVYSRLTRDGERAELARRILAFTAEDPQVRDDLAKAAALRCHAPGELCRAGLDLSALGIPAPPAND